MKRCRRIVQVGALLLVLAGVFLAGANCERWCPFGGVEGLYTYATAGDMLCSLGVSNFFLLGGVLATALLVRRAFCGYLCPIGAISEWLHSLGRRLGLPQVRVTGGVDRLLALLKYAVLVIILVATWRTGELVFRAYDPCYALISRHGVDITWWAYAISGLLAVLSLFMVLPFCRWLCPLAAVMNPFSRFGLARVKRDATGCSGCGVCSKDCPVAIPVHQVQQVTAARCLSCMNCVEACPTGAAGERALVWGPPGPAGRRWSQAAVIAIVLLSTATAVAASYVFPVPSFIRSRGDRPGQVATLEVAVENLSCRGRANLFWYFVDRDDMYKVPGYVKVEAWPGPGLARVRLVFDPEATDEAAIKQAITEPYYDTVADFWRPSPFLIEGYDPLALPFPAPAAP